MEQAIGMFLKGLQEEIRNRVRALNRISCDHAMDLSRHVSIATNGISVMTTKSRLSSSWSITSPSTPMSTRTFPKSDTPQPISFNKTLPAIGPPGAKGPVSSSINWTLPLSKSDWEERRRLGLCFSYGQKYSPQHKCASGQLRIMLLADDDEVTEDGEMRLADLDTTDDTPLNGECHALELCGVTLDSSSSDMKTLKLLGDIHGFPALILIIDSGASHNFLSKKLARALGLHLQPIGPLGIHLGDENRVHQCRNVPLRFGSFICSIDVLIYDLGPLDFILDVV